MQREFYRLKDNDKPSLSLVGAGELTLSIRIVSVNAKRTRRACPVSARNRTRSVPEGNNDEHVSLSTLVSSFPLLFFFFPRLPDQVRSRQTTLSPFADFGCLVGAILEIPPGRVPFRCTAGDRDRGTDGEFGRIARQLDGPFVNCRSSQVGNSRLHVVDGRSLPCRRIAFNYAAVLPLGPTLQPAWRETSHTHAEKEKLPDNAPIRCSRMTGSRSMAVRQPRVSSPPAYPVIKITNILYGSSLLFLFLSFSF